MELLSGSFGTGHAIWDGIALRITPRSVFSGDVIIHSNQIISVEALGGHSKKKVGQTVGLGATGAVVGGLLGPVGMLVGAAAGALAGGKDDMVTFGCRIKDGRSFVAKAKASEFFGFQRSPAPEIAEVGAPQLQAEADDADFLKPLPRREGTSPSVIECQLFRSVTELLNAEREQSALHHALTECVAAAEALNGVKWEYFDETLSDRDMTHVILMNIVQYEERISRAEATSDEVNERVKFDLNYLEVWRKTQRENPKTFWLFKKDQAAVDAIVARLEWELAPTLSGKNTRRETLEANISKRSALVNRFPEIVALRQIHQCRAHYKRCESWKETSLDWWRFVDDGSMVGLLKMISPEVGARETRSEVAQLPVAMRLLELQRLFDDRLISQSEFDAKRRSILDSI